VHRLRPRIPALTEALTGRFSDHHACLARQHPDLIDGHTHAIEAVTERIKATIDLWRVPGADLHHPGHQHWRRGHHLRLDRRRHVPVSPSGHLASWAGTCPSSNESPGRIKSTKIRPGNPYLKGSPRRDSDVSGPNQTPASGKYRRIAPRRAPMKALVAVEHAVLVAIWQMTATGALYDDPRPDFYTRLQPERVKRRALEPTPNHGL